MMTIASSSSSIKLHFCLIFATFFALTNFAFGQSHFNDYEDGRAQWISFSSTPPPSAFIQTQHSPSWSISHSSGHGSGQVRPYRRYIFGTPRFARPPDPHSVWREHIQEAATQHEMEPYPAGGGIPPEIPQAIKNYFSLDAPADKVVKELTGVDLRSILGSAMDHLGMVESTTMPGWTRATTPKDKLVEYFEKSLDSFLAGRFRPMERIPYLLENKGLMAKTNGTRENVGGKKKEREDGKEEEEEQNLMEGSGEAEEKGSDGGGNAVEDQPVHQQHSSISGIPKLMPTIPKIPLDFFNSRQEDPEIVTRMVDVKRVKAKEEEEEEKRRDDQPMEIRRHPVKKEMEKVNEKEEMMLAKTRKDYYQYGTKPTYQQGVLGSVLDFFGISSPAGGGGTVELDQVLTDWLMEHSPKHVTKMERRTNQPSSYALMKQLLSQPVMPLCTVQPDLIANFDIDSFMGQWFEVMFSPLLSSPTCTILSYRMLTKTSHPNAVGSLFQTVQFSVPKRNESVPLAMPFSSSSSTLNQSPQLSSGYGIVSRPGQMIFKKSNSPEEVIVHVIDAGYSPKKRRYEWAILGINCNYPIYVIARDPLLFKQKYERLVILTMERKGLINEVSRLLNLVSAVNPAHCQMPKNLLFT